MLMQELAHLWGGFSWVLCATLWIIHSWPISQLLLKRDGQDLNTQSKRVEWRICQNLSVYLNLPWSACWLSQLLTLRYETFLQLFFCFQHLVQSWKCSRMPQCWAPVGHRLFLSSRRFMWWVCSEHVQGILLKHCVCGVSCTRLTRACEIG